MKDFVTFDESQFPLVKVIFNFKDPTLIEFSEFIAGQKKALSYEKPFVLHMDCRKMGFLSSEIRIAQGNFFKQYKVELQTYCLGAVLLVSSPVIKMMIKGMMLIAPPPNTTVISSDEQDATRLVEAILTKNHSVLGKAETI